MPIELDPKALTESAARGAQEEDAFYAAKKPRGAHAFEARADGSIIIYATTRGKYADDLIRIEPHQVAAVLFACGDALARKPSTR